MNGQNLKKILLFVIGKTPQVITETIYALFKEKNIPDEVYAITTQGGKESLLNAFLNKGGPFDRFRIDYPAFKKIKFDNKHIFIIKDKEGKAISDIRSPEDNMSAATHIMHIVKSLSSKPNTQLIVSIAGGRKSMSFLVGYALSIYGREQDWITHVLVSEHFENNREFFYPSPKQHFIQGPNGKLDTSKAKIELAQVPYVRLRSKLSSQILENNLDFSSLINNTQNELAPRPSLKFNLPRREIICNGIVISLPPILFVFYVWLTRLKYFEFGSIRPKEDKIFAEDFRLVYDKLHLFRYTADSDRLKKILGNEIDFFAAFQEKISRINKSIRQSVPTNANIYCIGTKGTYIKCYELNIEKQYIHYDELKDILGIDTLALLKTYSKTKK